MRSGRAHRARLVLALAALCLATACSGSGDAAPSTTRPTLQATTEPTTEPTTGASITMTTDEPARPPVTDADGNTVEWGGPVDGLTIAVSPTSAQIDDEVSIRVDCPIEHTDVDVRFWEDGFNPTYGNGVLFKAPWTAPGVYETTARVPYWLGVGSALVIGSCGPGAEAVVEFEVVPSDRPIDLWRPLRGVWADDERIAGTPAPEPPGEFDRQIEVAPTTVHALCDAATPSGQARFIVWRDGFPEQSQIVTEEFVVPSDGYDAVDAGIVISTTIRPDAVRFGQDEHAAPIRVSALCVTPAAPFVPVDEPYNPYLIISR